MIELTAPGSAVRLVSVASHVTDCAALHGKHEVVAVIHNFTLIPIGEVKYCPQVLVLL